MQSNNSDIYGEQPLLIITLCMMDVLFICAKLLLLQMV